MEDDLAEAPGIATSYNKILILPIYHEPTCPMIGTGFVYLAQYNTTIRTYFLHTTTKTTPVFVTL
jgi:hypothetical protein